MGKASYNIDKSTVFDFSFQNFNQFLMVYIIETAFYVRKDKPTEIINQINRVEKLLKEQGFEVYRAIKSDVQRILAVYFEQNITQMLFDNLDGERFVDKITSKP